MKYLLFFISLNFLFFSCKKDGLTESPVLACIGEAQTGEEILECNSALNETYLQTYCTAIDAGTFTISDSSKLFFSQYCLGEEGEIRFQNANDDTITFTILTNEFLVGTFTKLTPYSCTTTPTKKAAVCIKTEYINFHLTSPSFDLLLRLNTRHELDFLDIDGVSDYLSISRSVQNTWQTELLAIVDQRTGSEEALSYQQNYSRTNIGSGTFTDVISNNSNNNSYRYYINPALGLFAFIDTENRLWTLIE